MSLDFDRNGTNDVSFSTVADANGNWAIDTGSATPTTGSMPAAGLANGAVIGVSARAIDGSNNLSPVSSGTLTIDTVPPTGTATIAQIEDDKPAIVGVVATGTVSNDDTPILSGTTAATPDAGEDVGVFRDGEFIGVANLGGTAWTFTDPGGMTSGAHTYTVAIRDAAGNTGPPSAGVAYEVDATVPSTPIIDLVEGDDVVVFAEAANGVPITGSAEPGSSVVISWLGVERTVVASPTGTWSTSFTGVQGSGEVLPVSAVATDAAGNSSTAGTRAVTVATGQQLNPTLGIVATDNRINAAEAAAPIALTGTASIGSTVTVTWGGTQLSTGPLTGNTWSLAFTPVPADSANSTISVVATDRFGSQTPPTTRTVVIDRVAPATPVIAIVEGNDLINSAEASNNVVITGTAEAGSTVAVTFNGITRTSVAGGGNWSATFTAAETPTGNGVSTTIGATAQDAAGNTSLAGTRTVTVDRVAPGQPTINVVSTDDQISSSEGSSPVTITGTTETGTTVSVGWGAQTVAATVTGTTWSATFAPGQLPADGPSSVRATSTDAAGNAGTEATRSVTVDRGPPTVTITSITDDVAPITGTVAGGGRTNDPTPTINGTISEALGPGQNLQVLRDGVVAGNATVSGGNWSFTDTGATPTAHTYTARGTDAGGNQGVSTGYTITIDTTAPGVPTITTPIATDGTVSASEASAGVAVSGTAEANASVTVAWGGTQTVTANGAGAWSANFAAGQIPGGDNVPSTITVTASDVAGNASTPATTSVTIDRVGPSATTVGLVAGDDVINASEAAGTVTLSGTAPGATSVSITWGGVTRNDAVDSGTWSLDYLPGQIPADGAPQIISVAGVDAAGNTGAATPRAVTIDRTPPTMTVTSAVDDFGNPATPVANNGTTDDATPTIQGSVGDATGPLTVNRNGAPAGTATVAGATWSFADSLSADGAYVYTVSGTDAAGNPGTSTGFTLNYTAATGGVGFAPTPLATTTLSLGDLLDATTGDTGNTAAALASPTTTIEAMGSPLAAFEPDQSLRTFTL